MTYLRDGDSASMEEAATKLRSFTTRDQIEAAHRIADRLWPDDPARTRRDHREWIDRVSQLNGFIKEEWPL